MIHLDANYLVLATVAGSAEASRIRVWLASGEQLGTSSIAWMEFVTGPVNARVVAAVSQVIQERIDPVGRDEAELAAHLFNLVGRKRALRYDCLIAASAIVRNAALATSNANDFTPLVPHGLTLAS